MTNTLTATIITSEQELMERLKMYKLFQSNSMICEQGTPKEGRFRTKSVMMQSVTYNQVKLEERINSTNLIIFSSGKSKNNSSSVMSLCGQIDYVEILPDGESVDLLTFHFQNCDDVVSLTCLKV